MKEVEKRGKEQKEQKVKETVGEGRRKGERRRQREQKIN